MVTHVPGCHAEMVCIRSGKVCKVAADFIDKLESDLSIGRAAAGMQLITSVRQTEPVRLFESSAERAAHDESSFFERQAPRVAFVRRIVNLVRRALPSIAPSVVEPETVNILA